MSLLFPIIDYCSLVYCDISKEQDSTIQRILNRGVRYVYGVKRFDHVTPLRRELGWLRAEGRRSYFMACFLFKLLRTETPSYLANLFATRVYLRPPRGEPEPLAVPRCRTEALRRSFHVSAAYLWNSLPPRIRSASTISTFKHLIFNHIFTAEGSK